MSPEPRAGFDPDELAPWEYGGPYLVTMRADTVEPSRPESIWEGWLSRGNVHLLVGRQGGGKSTLASWLAGVATTGKPFPNGLPHEPMTVGLLSLEEPADRLAARLHAVEADRSRVVLISDVNDQDKDGRWFRRPWRLPEDCVALTETIDREGIELLVIDGIGYSVTGESHNYAVVGSALAALVGVAERTGCAILGLTHPPKGGSDPTTAAIGSTAWTAIPRTVWVLGGDPQDETGSRRVVRVSKTNFKEPEEGLSFAIATNEEWECGYVTQLAPSHVTAEELVAAPLPGSDRTERTEAREFLSALLADGKMTAQEVFRATRGAQFSDSTVKRAKRDLAVKVERQQDEATGKVTAWVWSLPEKPEEQAKLLATVSAPSP